MNGLLFKAQDGNLGPNVIINGRPFMVKTFTYNWSTATDHDPGTAYVVVAGFFKGEMKWRIFRAEYRRNEFEEVT